jgi:hypothetical protein
VGSWAGARMALCFIRRVWEVRAVVFYGVLEASALGSLRGFYEVFKKKDFEIPAVVFIAASLPRKHFSYCKELIGRLLIKLQNNVDAASRARMNDFFNIESGCV